MRRKKIAVIGLGHFGLNLCLNLTKRQNEVLALDIKEERVELLRDKVSHVYIGDAKDIKVLNSLGLQDFDTVVVAIGEDFEASVLAIARLQEIGIKHIVGRVMSPVHEKILRLMNIEDLIFPEADSSVQLARKLSLTGIIESFELTEDFTIAEIKIPKALVGKKLEDVDLRKKYRINLITVMRKMKDERKGDFFQAIGVPSPLTVFNEDDIIVVFGHEKDINLL